MIFDIHTHTPTHVEAVPPDERQPNPFWRPDRVVEAAVSWADYLAASVFDSSAVGMRRNRRIWYRNYQVPRR